MPNNDGNKISGSCPVCGGIGYQDGHICSGSPFLVKHVIPDMNFRIDKFSPSVTLRVKISSEFMVRKWIALNLIKLAVIVLGCGLEVDDVTE